MTGRRISSPLVITGLLALLPINLYAGTVSQAPLLVESTVEPNILFLIDSSGSMNNIVPDTPYDPDTVYGCAASDQLNNDHSVDIQISGDGEPSFQYNGTVYDWGRGGGDGLTANSQHCFDPAADYMARLYGQGNTAPFTPSTYLAAQYKGNYLNWYFGTSTDGVTYGTSAVDWGTGTIRLKPGTERRLDIARSSATNIINSLDKMRVGLAVYNGSTGARIEKGVASLDAAHKTALTNAIANIDAEGATPLAEGLHQIGRYFVGEADPASPGHQTDASCTVNGQYDGDLTLHPDGTPSTLDDDVLFNVSPAYATGESAQSPICFSCQKNFVILLSDGRPQSDQNIPSQLQDYDGDCTGASPACASDDRKAGQEYESNGSDYLDDVALALYEIDLRPDILGPTGQVVNNVVTYTIGFADDQVINDPLMRDTAANGGGQFLTAANAGQLATAFNTAISDISGQISSASAVAISSTRLQTDTLAFQALFSSVDWSGQLLGRPVTSTGNLDASLWNGGAASSYPAPGSRNVLSWSPTDTAGFAFNSSNLIKINALTGANSLTTDQVNYLRGDQTLEEPAGSYRARSSLLGDIINSDPLFVGKTNYGNSRLPGAEGEAYLAFRDSSAYQSRADLLAVGANDGMLHGYTIVQGSIGGVDTVTGIETLAYIPTAVYGNLSELTDPAYTHNYYVDGSPVSEDAYLSLDGGAAVWRTVLVGTTGAGGSGVFALDITDPANIGTDDVLWDINAASSGFADLGFTIGEASIARFNDGNWYAVFGNGFNSASGNALIYLVQLDDASNVKVFDTGTAGSANGMASPRVVDLNGDRIADSVYAGDLNGQLWKVNVSASSSGSWALVDHDVSTTGVIDPLFAAVDAGGAAQPITSKLQVTKRPNGDLVILFGTGKFFESGDNVVDVNPQVQSFYGIHDSGAGTVIGRDELLVQSIVAELRGSPFRLRITSNEPLLPANRGWLMDLESPLTAQGERVIDQALVRDDRVVFSTLIPSTSPCSSGGQSWLMELDADTGARLSATPFDINEDGVFDGNDLVDYLGNPVAVSGIQDTSLGVIGGVSVLEMGRNERKVLTGSSGSVTVVGESGSGTAGRQSWQQLK